MRIGDKVLVNRDEAIFNLKATIIDYDKSFWSWFFGRYVVMFEDGIITNVDGSCLELLCD